MSPCNLLCAPFPSPQPPSGLSPALWFPGLCPPACSHRLHHIQAPPLRCVGLCAGSTGCSPLPGWVLSRHAASCMESCSQLLHTSTFLLEFFFFLSFLPPFFFFFPSPFSFQLWRHGALTGELLIQCPLSAAQQQPGGEVWDLLGVWIWDLLGSLGFACSTWGTSSCPARSSHVLVGVKDAVVLKVGLWNLQSGLFTYGCFLWKKKTKHPNS